MVWLFGYKERKKAKRSHMEPSCGNKESSELKAPAATVPRAQFFPRRGSRQMHSGVLTHTSLSKPRTDMNASNPVCIAQLYRCFSASFATVKLRTSHWTWHMHLVLASSATKTLGQGKSQENSLSTATDDTRLHYSFS